MVDSNRNRGTGSSDADFREPKGTGTDVLTNLEPEQGPEPTFRTAGTRNGEFHGKNCTNLPIFDEIQSISRKYFNKERQKHAFLVNFTEENHLKLAKLI